MSDERADPAMYRRVFVGHHEGAKVLEDLVGRFHDRPIYVAGGEDASRETQRRAAQNEVIGFILKLCALANQVDPNTNDSAGNDPLS